MAKLNEIEGLDEALAQARASARAEGVTEGYALGRKDATAIMSKTGHAGPEFAAKLAADPSIKPETAADLIAAVPEPKAAANTVGDYRHKLAAVSPSVGADNPAQSDDDKRTARIAQLSDIAKLSRKI